LPSASTYGNGTCAFVSNALNPRTGATVVGGGSTASPVFSNGTNWICGTGLGETTGTGSVVLSASPIITGNPIIGQHTGFGETVTIATGGENSQVNVGYAWSENTAGCTTSINGIVYLGQDSAYDSVYIQAPCLASALFTFNSGATINNTLTATGTLNLTGLAAGNANFATSQTTGNTQIGGTGATGSITLGRSTGAQTVNIATGTTAAATTKAINIGTAGNATSTTNIAIGSTTGTSTTTLNGTLVATGILTANNVRSNSATIASASTITPTSNTTNQYTVTALAVPATIAIPSGSPIDGQKLSIRIKDDGTARALTWTTSAGGFRVIGTTLPTTTTASKVTYVGCVYNSQDSFWDVLAVATQA
jgi:hypothetical protein